CAIPSWNSRWPIWPTCPCPTDAGRSAGDAERTAERSNQTLRGRRQEAMRAAQRKKRAERRQHQRETVKAAKLVADALGGSLDGSIAVPLSQCFIEPGETGTQLSSPLPDGFYVIHVEMKVGPPEAFERISAGGIHVEHFPEGWRYVVR